MRNTLSTECRRTIVLEQQAWKNELAAKSDAWHEQRGARATRGSAETPLRLRQAPKASAIARLLVRAI